MLILGVGEFVPKFGAMLCGKSAFAKGPIATGFLAYKKVNHEKINLDINTGCVVHHNGCACWLRATQTARVPKQVRNMR